MLTEWTGIFWPVSPILAVLVRAPSTKLGGLRGGRSDAAPCSGRNKCVYIWTAIVLIKQCSTDTYDTGHLIKIPLMNNENTKIMHAIK